jgi:D-3-phosphoglycerate dehydrogenase
MFNRQISESAVELFRAQGYTIDTEKSALGEDDLIARLNKGGYTAVGIRSKTKVTAKVIDSVKSVSITQHLRCEYFADTYNCSSWLLDASALVQTKSTCSLLPVLVSPSSTLHSQSERRHPLSQALADHVKLCSSRSVAELVISEIVALSRQLCDRSAEMHQGVWNKVSKGCWEIRGKVLGIVGYGHIGAQLSVLAEAMGMQVRYFDVVPIMALGSAIQIETLDGLLAVSDFLSLHVPELPETTDMIGAEELVKMKKGSYLINNARGKVVDIPALAASLKAGHLAGAAIDVYPKEPAGNGKNFTNELNSFFDDIASCNNVILTPHIGGSTEEAQRNIGSEVAGALIRYINFGASIGAVNFPEVSLKPIIEGGIVRVCHIHMNQPGVLKSVNAILGAYNVERQLSDSKGDIAYLMADIANVTAEAIQHIYDEISVLPANVATRVLY